MNSEGLKEFIRLIAFSPVQLDFKLVFNQADVDKYKIDIDNINSIKDMEAILENNEILNKIVLTSNSFIINTLLYINKCSKNKIFTECIPFKKLNFSEEDQCFKKVLKFVADKNYLYFVEKNTTINYNNEFVFIIDFKGKTKTFNIKFIDDEIKDTINNNTAKDNTNNNEGSDIKIEESYNIDTNNPNNPNTTNNPNKTEQIMPTKILELLDYPFNTRDYFLIDLNFLVKLSINELLQIMSFIDDLINTTNLKIIVTYPSLISNIQNLNFEMMPIINEILTLTDIYIFEKREIGAFFDIMNELSEENKNLDEQGKKAEIQFIKIIRKKTKDVKIGLFLNEFKTCTVIEQHPQTNLVLCHTDNDFDLISGKQMNIKNYDIFKKLIEVNFQLFKGIYFGTFLSKFFHKKTFNNCHFSGKKLVLKVLDALRKVEVIDLPTDPEFYIIQVKTTKIEKQLGNELMVNKREVSFVLDCVSKNNSKMNEYNPLHDNNLKIYFNSYQNRKNLKKMGFINKNGFINPDPDHKFLGGVLKDKNLKGQLEHNQNKLLKLKDKSDRLQGQISGLCLMKLPELNSIRREEINKLSLDFIEKPRLIKLPALEKKWEGHPLLMQSGGRALSLDNLKSKHRPNNENSYDHLSKIIKNANNSKVKQNISNILSPTVKKETIIKKKQEKKMNLNTNIKINNNANKVQSYEDLFNEINNKDKDNIYKTPEKKKDFNKKDSSKIQYQKKNNVIINKVEDKKVEKVEEEKVFDTEVEEEKHSNNESKQESNNENKNDS